MPATGFEVFCANRPELLARLARHRLQQAASDLAEDDLRPLPVLVGSLAARDRLRDDLAEACGVCAGLDLLLPGEFADRWLPRRLGLPVDTDDDAVRRWRLADALDGLPGLHVAGPHHDARRLALADRLADALVKLDAWAPGRGPQAWRQGARAAVDEDFPFLRSLWPAFTAEGDPFAQRQALLARVADHDDLPPLILAVATPELSPPLLELLAALGRRTLVQVLLLQPVPGDWSDHGLAWRGGAAAEEGWSHPLLAAWGVEHRQALRRFADAGAEITSERAYFAAVEGDHLLGRLRRDLGDGRAPTPGSTVDDSIVFQHAFGPRAEVEALKHRLAAWCDAGGFAPHEIAVCCPDPERYAPLLAAVFACPGEGPRIPVDLRPASLAADPAQALALILLDLLPGRWRAGDVLHLLTDAAVGEAWELDGNDRRRVADWCDRADLRFGVDAAHRAELGLPSTAAATWRHGLQRLAWSRLLGADADAVPLRDGVAPVPGLDEDDTVLAARLCDLLLPLLDRAAESRRPQPLAWWAKTIPRLVAHLRGDDADQHHAALVRTLDDALSAQAAAGVTAPVTADLVAALLGEAGRRLPPRLGGVAVGTPAVLRGRSWQVLCLIGMDDGAFPRQAPPGDVDPLRREPPPGLPDPRIADRAALLDLLLSTTRHLLVSWTGSDVHAGTPLPPCPAVADLLTVVAIHVGRPPQDLVQRIGLHRLPPGPWPSPQRRAADLAPAQPAGSALTASAPLPDADPPLLALDDLARDLADTPGAFLRRLGLRLEAQGLVIDDDERLVLDDSLESWRLRDLLATRLRGGGDADVCLDRWQAEGRVPRHAWGRLQARPLVEQARCLAEDDLWQEITTGTQTLRLDGDGLTVEALLTDLHPESGPVVAHAGALHPRLLLRAHLAGLCHQAAGGTGGGLVLALDLRQHRALRVALPPTDDAPTALRTAIAAWRQVRRRPLPFSAEVLAAWAGGEDDLDDDARLDAARRAWVGTGFDPRPPPAAQPAAERLWPDGADAWAGIDAATLAAYADLLAVRRWARPVKPAKPGRPVPP